MKYLLDMNPDELKYELSTIGEPSYRANQIIRWLHSGITFDNMSNIPKSLRGKLCDSYCEGFITELQKQVSLDGTVKRLFELRDAQTIESVYMPKEYGNSLCISTQVGCACGCVFCASGVHGLKRNLTAGEMLAQVIAANCGSKQAVTSIVLMGMGEPLYNLDAVLKFTRLVNLEQGLNLSRRSITLSTCGIPLAIRELADSGAALTLSISLHAATDEKRIQIMPIAKKYTIQEVVSAANYYFEKTGRRVSYEYIMISGFNDQNSDALQLKELFFGLNCHINLIPLNNTGTLKASSKKNVYAFCDSLNKMGLSATVRKSMGSDIDGACGQLRQRYIKAR